MNIALNWFFLIVFLFLLCFVHICCLMQWFVFLWLFPIFFALLEHAIKLQYEIFTSWTTFLVREPQSRDMVLEQEPILRVNQRGSRGLHCSQGIQALCTFKETAESQRQLRHAGRDIYCILILTLTPSLNSPPPLSHIRATALYLTLIFTQVNSLLLTLYQHSLRWMLL